MGILTWDWALRGQVAQEIVFGGEIALPAEGGGGSQHRRGGIEQGGVKCEAVREDGGAE